MLTFVTVLRSGGQYRPEHVQRLRAQIDQHYHLPHRHVCLTDLDGITDSKPLQLRWPGWWSKLELFLYDYTDPVCYLDLDVTIRDSIDWLLEALPAPGQLAAMKDASRPGMNSSVMLWQDFPLATLMEFNIDDITYWKDGDQQWIEAHLAQPFIPLLPPQVSSFKGHGPESASIVVYHGKPKPWDPDPNNRAHWT